MGDCDPPVVHVNRVYIKRVRILREAGDVGGCRETPAFPTVSRGALVFPQATAGL